MGNLIEHEGAITDLAFYQNKYLFSSSEDNTICVWNMSTINCDKKLKGHKQSIQSISLHPSGKLMLSVSKDKTVRTWNLIKGRLAFVTNLKEAASLVEWSLNGKNFILAYAKRIDNYDVKTCGIVNSIELDQAANCVKYLNEDRIVIGNENGELSFANVFESECFYTFKAHDRRIKDVYLIQSNLIPIKCCSTVLITISSDGLIRLWNVDLDKQTNELITEHNINCRLNCIAFFKNDQ